MDNVDDLPLLAPELEYRIVFGRTIALRGDRPAHGSVTFSIRQTLLFSAGVTIEPSSIRINFKDHPSGQWAVRLPHIGNAMQLPEPWGITVKFSGRPYPYLIRVPAGPGSINIQSIPEWRP